MLDFFFKKKSSEPELVRMATAIDEVLTPQEQVYIRAGSNFFNAKYQSSEITIGAYNCSYHANLTAVLTEQQSVLVKLLEATIDYSHSGSFGKANEILTKFRESWTLHVKTGNVLVYNYIIEMVKVIAPIVSDQAKRDKLLSYSKTAAILFKEVREYERVMRQFLKSFICKESKLFALDLNNSNDFLLLARGKSTPTGQANQTTDIPALSRLELRFQKEQSHLFRVYDELSPSSVEANFLGGVTLKSALQLGNVG